MNVKDLCLGALTIGDASGYDLKKFFETTFSHFCVAGYGSIYPALAELATEGLVRCHEQPQQGRPGRKLYQLTAAGRKAFLQKLEKTAPRHTVKSDFLLSLYFAHLLPPQRLETILDERIAEIERQLSCHARCRRQSAQGSGEPVGERFVRGFGKAVLSAAREYLRVHRRELASASTARSRHMPNSPRRTLRGGLHALHHS